MSTTITGNIKDLSGGAVTSNTYLRFILRGLNGNIPRVNGTALVAQNPGFGLTGYWFDLVPNASGQISGTLYSTRDAAGTGNGEIEAGGSLTAVWYGMVLFTGGNPSAEIPVHAKNGVTLDISNVTPITTTPVSTAPTGDTTYARLDGGNQPFTGAVSAANQVNGTLAMKPASTAGVLYVTASGSDSNDGLSWGSAKATISAALTALPSTGGTIYFAGTIAQNTALTLKSNVNIIGIGNGQADSVTPPAMITTTLGSGDLFYLNGFNDCLLANFAIKNTGSAGANAAIRLTAAQRNVIQNIYISGPFLVGVQLDSSASAAASCIWNQFSNIHTTGLTTNGIGLLLDSKDASAKVINSNFFYNFQATGGTSGCGIKLTNSGVHNQVINENVFWASEASASGGTALLVDQGSTRGCVFIDLNAEGSTTGLNKAISNTLTFVGGNFSSNSGSNVTDAQSAFTVFIGTNVGGTVQAFSVTPVGDMQIDGIGINASPSSNAINGATGWKLKASGTDVLTVNSGSAAFSQPLTGANMVSASAGNSVTLLNVQNNQGAITGNGADQTIFSWAIPANIVASGKAVRIRFWFSHSTGTAGVNYKFKIGSTTISNYGSPSATGTHQGGIILHNQGSGLCTKIDDAFISGTPALQTAPGYGAGNTGDFSAGFTVSVTFNVANTDAVTPQYWVAELIA